LLSEREKVLRDISFSLGKGECLGILGTNGVGKSTLLKCLNRIHKFREGKVMIGEQELSEFSRNDLAKKIGYVSQSAQFARSTVFDTVLLGRKPYIKWDVMQHDLDVVHEVLEALHLEPFAMRYVDELSGGELQKVSIARALAQEPDILMFDEPTSNLDLKNQLEVANMIKRIVKEKDISAIVTMHDLNLALRCADKYVMIQNGEVFAAGGKEVMTEKNIEQVYATPVAIEYFNGMPVVIPL
jgi:iron complex transport system ATP-binding protein